MTRKPARKSSGDRLVIASHNPGKVTRDRRTAPALRPRPSSPPASSACASRRRPARPSRRMPRSRRAPPLRHPACRRWPTIPAWWSPALGGDPGIYSARWAGPAKDFAVAMAKVERGAGGHRTTAARTSPAPSRSPGPTAHVETFEGTVRRHPRLAAARRARLRLRPDLPARRRMAKPSARWTRDRKHAISHRAGAFRQLVAACFDGK